MNLMTINWLTLQPDEQDYWSDYHGRAVLPLTYVSVDAWRCSPDLAAGCLAYRYACLHWSLVTVRED